MGTAGRLGSEAWRRYPHRAPPDAADGTFFADPLSQILNVRSVPPGTRMRPVRFQGMQIKHSLHIAGVLIALPGVAIAQSPPTPATPPAAASNCSPTQPVPRRGTIAPEGATTGQSAEPLGDRLAKSDGVLCPPAGSPGGDPGVRPK